MRLIPKPGGTEAEACIQGFIDVQMAARAEGIPWDEVKVDYGSFTRGPQLRGLLVDEQKGLCAYTGAPLDERLTEKQPSRLNPPHTDYWFKPHIEHLKPEEQCREELTANQREVGRDVGEDMAYPNLVVAIEVSGTPKEQFGASFRGTKPLPILPTMPECERSFEYLESGRVLGTSDEAKVTITNLRLDHATLESWRRGAVRAFLGKAADYTTAELETLARLDGEGIERLDEFAFGIAPLARFTLAKRNFNQ